MMMESPEPKDNRTGINEVTENETEEYEVSIPEESFSLLEFEREEIFGSAVINTALRGFEPKIVFGWHLSMIIELKEVDDEKMPTDAERDVIDQFGKTLDLAIVGENTEKPNAVFLGQVLWNGGLELVWRVFEPDPVNDYLQSIVNETGDLRPRAFDFRMEHDAEWKLCEWHLAEHPEAE